MPSSRFDLFLEERSLLHTQTSNSELTEFQEPGRFTFHLNVQAGSEPGKHTLRSDEGIGFRSCVDNFGKNQQIRMLEREVSSCSTLLHCRQLQPHLCIRSSCHPLEKVKVSLKRGCHCSTNPDSAEATCDPLTRDGLDRLKANAARCVLAQNAENCVTAKI